MHRSHNSHAVTHGFLVLTPGGGVRPEARLENARPSFEVGAPALNPRYKKVLAPDELASCRSGLDRSIPRPTGEYQTDSSSKRPRATPPSPTAPMQMQYNS